MRRGTLVEQIAIFYFLQDLVNQGDYGYIAVEHKKEIAELGGELLRPIRHYYSYQCSLAQEGCDTESARHTLIAALRLIGHCSISTLEWIEAIEPRGSQCFHEAQHSVEIFQQSRSAFSDKHFS